MKTLFLATALLFVAFVMPSAAADPYVCSHVSPDCEGVACVALRALDGDSPVRDVVVIDDETPSCLIVDWPPCVVEVVSTSSTLCFDPSSTDCPVKQIRDGEVRCVGNGSTEVGFGSCHVHVASGETALCADPDGPCFVALVEGPKPACVVGIPA